MAPRDFPGIQRIAEIPGVLRCYTAERALQPGWIPASTLPAGATMLISIYPLAKGQYREMRAEAGVAASGPFDAPDVIPGRLLGALSSEDLGEIRANEVLFEGEVYRFDLLQSDGVFELRKAW